MAACATTIDKAPISFGAGHKMATYTFVGGTTGWLAAGHAVDITADFTEVHAAWAAGVDTVADHAYKWGLVFPKDTTITSSNFLLTAHYSTGAGGAMTVVPDAADLSAVGQVQIVVIGK